MPDQVVKQYDLRHLQRLSIAIISDTHGQVDPAVVAVVGDADVVLHAGDIMGSEVLDQLQPRRDQVIAVRGNNDFSSTWRADPTRLGPIPDAVLIRCSGGLIAMEHGHLIHQIELHQYPLGYKYADARLVVYGHTHVQKFDDSNTPWLLNPGAAGAVRNQGGASCYRLDIDGDDWQLTPFKFAPMRASA